MVTILPGAHRLFFHFERDGEGGGAALAGFSVRTALVYDGHLSPQLSARGYFDALVPVSGLMGMNR